MNTYVLSELEQTYSHKLISLENIMWGLTYYDELVIIEPGVFATKHDLEAMLDEAETDQDRMASDK